MNYKHSSLIQKVIKIAIGYINYEKRVYLQRHNELSKHCKIRMEKLPAGQRASIQACRDWKRLKKRNKVDLAKIYGGSRGSWPKRM